MNNRLQHEQWATSEFYTGTKAQLQGIGIGCGKPFPGEPGGPTRGMTVADALGRRWQITKAGSLAAGQFQAVRKRTVAERAAHDRKRQVEKQLEAALPTEEAAKEQARWLIRVAVRTLRSVDTLSDAPTAFRTPGPIRARLDEIAEELEAMESAVACCDMEVDQEGQRQIRRMQQALSLYSEPAMASILAGAR
jgi:hypothetical protein